MRNRILVSALILVTIGVGYVCSFSLLTPPVNSSFSYYRDNVLNVNETNTEVVVTALEAGTLSSGATITGGNTDVEALDGFQSGLVSVTNAGTYTVSNFVITAFSTGGGNLTTNTIVLARPTSAGMRVLYNSPTSTNLIAIAATNSWNGSAIELAAGEAVLMFGLQNADGTGTNAWDGQEL